MSNLLKEYQLFMMNHRTEARPTHVSLFGPKGKYHIEGPDLNEFWRLYRALYTVEPLGIAETQSFYPVPVIADIDLKVDHDTEHPCQLYESQHVKSLVQIFQRVLKDLLPDICDENLVCLVLEKPPYTTKKNGKQFYKNGFHLHFPFIFLSRPQMDTIMMPQIRADLRRMDSLPFGITDPESMIDHGFYRGSGQPWLLYGSRKEANMESYTISGYYDMNGQMHTDYWNIFHNSKDEVEIHLPELLSISVYGKEKYVHDIPIRKKSVNICPPIDSKNENSSSFDVIRALLDCLPDRYAEDRNLWMKVGWILFNIYKGSEDGLKLWSDFSKRCIVKYSDYGCQNEWTRMEYRDLTIGSLKFLARHENPKKFQEIMVRINQPLFDKSLKLEGTHHDIAQIMYEKYDSEYTCASIQHRMWYYFTDHVWKKIEDGYHLRARISTEIVEEYEKIAKDLMTKAIQSDDDQMDNYKKKVNIVLKLVKQLKSSPYKSHIMKEAMEIFYDESFLKKLDADPYLIGFQNGIYDFKKHEFRIGHPEDHVSMKLNVKYRSDLTMQSDEVLMVMDFFEKIFPDIDLRDYFMNTTCDVFIGGNFNKIFQIWTGDGDNGKSITQSLYEQMLGPYSIKLPTSLISGKRTQSSAACPELVRAGNGVRMAMLQEPDQKDVINIGILKELSGNDTFYARGLFREGQEITPMFKLTLICNDPPKIPYNDRATWNRIRVIPFEAFFSDEAPATKEEQMREKIFPKDPQFKDKIPKMIEALAWYLIERMKIKPKVILEPEKVRLATLAYQKKNDIYGLFMDEHIEDDPDGAVSASEMYNVFRDWHHDNLPNSVLPTKIDMQEYFTKKWGHPRRPKMNWIGHKISNHAENVF